MWPPGEPPGRLLGPPGDLLGRPGASQGSSWRVLGLSWGDLFSRSNFDRFWHRFWSPRGCPKGAQREPFWEPRWVQNRSKIGLKNEDEKKTLLGGSWVDFGPILGRLGSHPGPKIHQILLVLLVFPEKQRFGRRSVSKSDPRVKRSKT